MMLWEGGESSRRRGPEGPYVTVVSSFAPPHTAAMMCSLVTGQKMGLSDYKLEPPNVSQSEPFLFAG